MSSIRFDEVMRGRLAPWALDTDDGYDAENAFSASLRARISIADLGLLVDRDVPHRAKLWVELEVPILSGRPFVAYDGAFELFRRGDIPSGGRGRLMVYDAVLTDGERFIVLTGRKYLTPGRILRLWSETTTMRVILRDVTHGGRVDVGTDCAVALEPPPAYDVQEPAAQRDFLRPRWLAGKVRLTPSALFNQVGSMNAADARWYRAPFVISRFLWFFAASLVRIYVFRARA